MLLPAAGLANLLLFSAYAVLYGIVERMSPVRHPQLSGGLLPSLPGNHAWRHFANYRDLQLDH